MNGEIKTLIRISVVVAILVFALLICFGFKIGDAFSCAISSALVFTILFNSWIWKCPLLHPRLIWTPNLNGKWKCTIDTSYEGKKKKVNADVVIKQTYTSIHVMMVTKESKSSSKNGLLEMEEGTEQVILSYVYENLPNVQIRDRSQIHFGAVRLEVKDKNIIEGEYWTDRKSVGMMVLTRIR